MLYRKFGYAGILKSKETTAPGQNISPRAGTKKPKPDYSLAGPGYYRSGRSNQPV
jgi:hypothetical protein